jgi:hypothetical protein
MTLKQKKPFYTNGAIYVTTALLYFLGFCFIAPELETSGVRILFWGVFLPLEALTGLIWLAVYLLTRETNHE